MTLSLSLALLLLAPPPPAPSTGVLAVAEPPGPHPELAQLAGQLATAIAARDAGAVDAAQLRERMVGPSATATLAELDRAYAGALAAHGGGDFEGAIRTLRTVVSELERLPDGPEPFGQWSRAMLRLARSEQAMGRRVEAQAVLERLLRAAPEAQADPLQYPPSFRDLVDEAREKLRAHGTHRLTVQAQAGARVFVDGRDVGPAPLSLEVTPGRHRISASHSGIRTTAVVADLSADNRIVELDLSLAEVLRPDGGPGLALPERDRPARVITAAARLGLDRVVTARLSSEGEVRLLVAAILDVRRGTAEREGRLRLASGAPPPGGVEALAEFLLRGESSSLLAPPPVPAPLARVAPPAPAASLAAPSPARHPVPQLFRSPAQLGAVGAGLLTAVAGGLAIHYAVRAEDRYRSARAMLDPSGLGVARPRTILDYNAAVRSGNDARDRALLSGAATGVGLGATALFLYLGYRQTGEPGPLRF